MADLLHTFDNNLLNDDTGPAAITFEHWLKPVGDPIIFPPTYANPSQQDNAPPVYNIDRFGDKSTLKLVLTKFKKTEVFVETERVESGQMTSVCTVDSIPSQANRIEPAFAWIAGGKLVPQVKIKAKQGKEEVEVDLLEAGHRAADAIVRFAPEVKDKIESAMQALKRRDRDALPLAKLAPTSLVFGMWDSRGTGVKVPRLLNSIIRAYDVLEHRRSAQYFPAINYADAGVAKSEGELEKMAKASTEGMAEVPATFAHGGIEARGGICRRGSLNLVTLRDLTTHDANEAMKLRRYILGLSLVALTYFDGKTLNLRQGCQLVADPERGGTRCLVYADGSDDKPFELSKEEAIAYAEAAAADFGVDAHPVEGTFDPKLAKQALSKKD